jgi:hypothetical protein
MLPFACMIPTFQKLHGFFGGDCGAVVITEQSTETEVQSRVFDQKKLLVLLKQVGRT